MTGLPVTEIAYIPLKQDAEGLSYDSTDPQARELVDYTMHMLETQRGCVRACTGLKVEGGGDVMLQFIGKVSCPEYNTNAKRADYRPTDWDTIEDHHNWSNSKPFQEFAGKLMPAVKSFDDIWLMHVDFDSSITGPCSAPYTEVVFYYVPAISEEFEKAWRNFIKLSSADNPKGLHSETSGWMREEVEHENLGKGVKGRAYVAILGWDSPEHHMRYRETEAFKKNIQEPRKHAKGVQMVSPVTRYAKVC